MTSFVVRHILNSFSNGANGFTLSHLFLHLSLISKTSFFYRKFSLVKVLRNSLTFLSLSSYIFFMFQEESGNIHRKIFLIFFCCGFISTVFILSDRLQRITVYQRTNLFSILLPLPPPPGSILDFAKSIFWCFFLYRFQN